MSVLVGNSEDRFSHVAANMQLIIDAYRKLQSVLQYCLVISTCLIKRFKCVKSINSFYMNTVKLQNKFS